MSTPTTESLSLSLLNSHGDPYSDLEDRGSISDDSASDDGDLSDAEKGASPSSKRAGSYGTNALGMSHLAPPYTPPMSPAPGGTRQGLEEKEMREKARKASALPAGGKHHRRRSSAAPATAEKHVDWMRVLPIWILSLLMGIFLVMSNKYILSDLKFPFPIFLTTCHMGFAVVGTRILKVIGPRIVPGFVIAENELSWNTYLHAVLPIGILFSGSLILSNFAVMMLSISLVQMLKAFIPAAILIVSAIFGIRKLTVMSISVILIISFGCALAAFGEVKFSLPGFICQLGAVVSESLRLVLIQILLQGHSLDPLTSLHHYAPVCLVLNLVLIPLVEGPAPILAVLYPPQGGISIGILLANAAIAFSLNLLGLILIQRVGGLVLSLAGVVKDIALIIGSAAFFGNEVRSMQIAGYGLSIVGLYIYRYKA